MDTRSAVLREIESLDPERDYARISYLSICFDFPWDVTHALDLALLKGSCVPSISGLQARTGEFVHRTQKRYDDTLLILAELLESGHDSERGRAAQRRMNRIHHRFPIANDDYLYILSTSVVEPIRFNARFGWRPYSETEVRAYFNLWAAIGRRMGIRDVPRTLAELERYHDDFERERFAFSPSNRANAAAMIEMFSGWYPAPLRPAVRAGIRGLLADEVLDALGLPRPTPRTRRLVEGVLHLRARLLQVGPRRTRPFLHTRRRSRTYPHGHRIEELGPR
ncbi:MAG TPA: oxygenase MpaB family protein [Terriglobales bacterium]|nr:oxygenase MpaB family protein [Terriglobales bacterium]